MLLNDGFDIALSLHGILQKDGRSPPLHPQLRPYDKKLPHFQSDDINFCNPD